MRTMHRTNQNKKNNKKTRTTEINEVVNSKHDAHINTYTAL